MPLKLGLFLSDLEVDKHILALEKLKKEIEISGIVFTNEKEKNQFKEFKVYKTIDELFEKEKIDAIFISSEINEQKDLIIKCLNNKTNVLLEHPNFSEISVFDEILDKLRQKEKTVFFSNSILYLPVLKAVKELICENISGKLNFFHISILENKDFNFQYKFAPILWKAFGILGFICDKNPISLNTFLEKESLQNLKKANISIKFLDSFADIYINRQDFSKLSFIIHCEKLNLFFDGNSLKIERKDIEVEEIKFKSPDNYHILQEIYLDFLKAIEDKKFAENNLKDAAKNFRLFIASLKANNYNKVVPV